MFDVKVVTASSRLNLLEPTSRVPSKETLSLCNSMKTWEVKKAIQWQGFGTFPQSFTLYALFLELLLLSCSVGFKIEGGGLPGMLR